MLKLSEGSALDKRKKISASARQRRGVNEDIQTCIRADASTLGQLIIFLLIYFAFTSQQEEDLMSL